MNRSERRPIVILHAEDDPDDRMLTKEAMEEIRARSDLRFVSDGEDLMDYLKQEGDYDPRSAPPPDLILLDLSMPKKDGYEVLQELKENPSFRHIPVVVLTTSEAEDDVRRVYNLGVSSFITKPVTFDGLVEVMRAVMTYWFDIVRLPGGRDRASGAEKWRKETASAVSRWE